MTCEHCRLPLYVPDQLTMVICPTCNCRVCTNCDDRCPGPRRLSERIAIEEERRLLGGTP